MYQPIKISINDALTEYFDSCPLIERSKGDNWVAVEYLGNDISFSISALPLINNGLTKRDVVGNETYDYIFQFSAKFKYSPDVLKMIENSTFFENLVKWVDSKNSNKEYPLLSEEDNRYSLGMTVSQSPMIIAIDDASQFAQYIINFDFKYIERKM